MKTAPVGRHQRAPEVGTAAVPEISVVIPHLNQPGPLAACLAALGQQTLAPERFEVLVVDNGSTPAARGRRRRPSRACGSPTRPSPGRGRRATAASPWRGRRSSPSSTPTASPIPAGWRRSSPPSPPIRPAAVLGGAVRVFAETPGRPNLAEAFDLVYGFRQELTIARHDFAATANLAVRRAVFAAVGGFAGLSVSEDMDWGRRAKLAGFPTRFVPEAAVRASGAPLDGRPAPPVGPARQPLLEHAAEDRPRPGGMGAPGGGGGAPRRWSRSRASSPATGCRARASASPPCRALAAMRLYRARRMLAELAGPASRQRSARWNRLTFRARNVRARGSGVRPRASRSAGRAGPPAPRRPRRSGGAGSRALPAGAPASRRSPRGAPRI